MEPASCKDGPTLTLVAEKNRLNRAIPSVRPSLQAHIAWAVRIALGWFTTRPSLYVQLVQSRYLPLRQETVIRSIFHLLNLAPLHPL